MQAPSLDHKIWIYRKALLAAEEGAKLPNEDAQGLPNGTAQPSGPSGLGARPSDLVGKAAGSKRRGVAPGSFLDLLVGSHVRCAQQAA